MIEYNYLRPLKGEYLKKREEAIFIKKESLKHKAYKDAVILPLTRPDGCNLLFGLGGVIDNNGSYVESSGISTRVGGSYPFEIYEKRDEKVVYCGYFINHWGHFLLETVSRLWYWFEDDETVDKYVFFVKENESLQFTGNYLRFLKLLGIADKIDIINKPVQYREVIVPELGYFRMHYYSDKHKKIFDTVAANALKNARLPGSEKKVFFSRAHFKKASDSEIGNDLLDSFFSNNGFKLLYPEELSLEEMICYIRNAEICAMPSGTAPHNLLFAQDNKKTIIIERTMLINEMQVDVDRIKDLNVTYIDGNWLIYPGLSGGGPFCYAYTRQFDAYAKDNDMKKPDLYYLSDQYKKRSLRRFLKVHQNFFAYDWGMEKWTTIYAKEIYEAHEETVEDLYDYIAGIKPFIPEHFFRLSYIKKAMKQTIKK